MQKRTNMLRLAAAIGVAGAVGFTGAVNAADFDVTVEIQNALEVTVVQDMSFGTLFATVASGNSGTDGYSFLRLNPDGTFEDVPDSVDDDIPLISLGGAQAARGSVAVGSTADFTVVLPDMTAELEGTPADSDILAGVPMRIGGSGGDPSVARFFLVNFQLGDVVGGDNLGDDSDNKRFVLDPSFGSTEVEFGIGADIVTDVGGSVTNRNTYEAGTYEGTFEVTATY